MAWEQLQQILLDNREELSRAATEKPVACPNCGTPLQERDNILNCPFGDYRLDL